MTFTEKQIANFQSRIFRWWKTNKRDLPWRHTRNPYAIAVSEVMLQQTQVSRVLSKYVEFMNMFPTVDALAKAPAGKVLRVWKGMGYNRRALYLHKMAKIIEHHYKGNFPKDEKSLDKLPGLGKYTARAILVFAYEEHIACVDTNIRQIITHFFFHDKEQSVQTIQAVADRLVPKGKSWEWHQALMDYGSVHNSEFIIQKSAVNKNTIPFKETDRFIRGKIIDYLRTKSYRRNNLVQQVSATYNKQVNRIKIIIEDLQQEGLIEIHRQKISLPK